MSKLFIYCNYSIIFNDLLYWLLLPSRCRPKIVRSLLTKGRRFIRRILVASNAIKTIDNEIINLTRLHYLMFELHSTRPKFMAFFNYINYFYIDRNSGHF
jgi:hypothetical protein